MKENLLNENESNSKQKEKGGFERPQFLEFNESDYDLERAGHPVVVVMCVLFKGLAIMTYMLLSLLMSQVMTMIVITLLSTIDFWVTKNIGGRMLVGLRWWRCQNIQGQEQYLFESHQTQHPPNKVDSTFFWSSQVLAVLFWALMCLLNILAINLYWSLLTALQLLLLSTNLYAFYYCRSDHQQKIDQTKEYLKNNGKQGLKQAQGYIINKAVQNYSNHIMKNKQEQV